MNKYQEIINAKVVGYKSLQRIIINEENVVENISPITQNSSSLNQCLDIKGDWLSLGGIDLQINGALGLAFPDLERKDIPKLKSICQYLWQEGIDGFLPTIVTTSIDKIQNSLQIIHEYISKNKSKNEAQIIGVHLEGPFLNYEKRGAHPPEHLLNLTLANIQKILDKQAEVVKIITLAPELEAKEEVIKYLKSLGITISLGHSLATDEQARKAFDNGATMVTHAFNAMPSLHHREVGLLGEAITNKNVYCGLIADGIHVHPTMIKILLEASNYEEGIFLVSDALAPIGLSDGIYPWDERKIKVKNGTARLENGTLSGTTLPLLVGAQNLVNWGICNSERAIKMATESPRKAIQINHHIQQGIQANFLRWHYNEQDNKLYWQRISSD